jgi:hypothetical protein
VSRALEETFLVRDLDDLAEVHDGYPRRDMLDDGQVVSDKQIRESELLLQIDQQIDHLCLYRNIERRYRFIQHDQFRMRSQGARYSDALPLPAGKLVWVAIDLIGTQSDTLEQFRHPGT